MKRNWIIVFFIALTITLLSVIVNATSQQVFYHISINDQLPISSLDVTPIEVNGTIYIPYTIFDQSITGVDIGVYCSHLRTTTSYTVTVYSFNSLLTFNLVTNSTTDRSGNTVPMTAVIRNNQIYLPARSVCNYFDLTYHLYATSYGNLLRITNGDEYLSGDKFLENASTIMVTRYNDYLQGTTSSTTTTIPVITTQSPAPAVTTTPTTTTVSNVDILLGFVCDTSGDTSSILDTLDNANYSAMFFFEADEIFDHAEDIIRIVGSGHNVGLSLNSTTWEDAQIELSNGLADFRAIAQVVPHTILSKGASWETDLEEWGWTLWNTTLDGIPLEEDTASALTYRLQRALTSLSQQATILMDNSTYSNDALSSMTYLLMGDTYQVIFPSEYEISS